MKKINSLGVFCSASSSLDPLYYEFAKNFAKEIPKKNIELVYGGASIGMMGSIADAALDQGGVVRGVVPKVILEREFAHPKLSELIITEDMHERKKRIYELSDAIAVLPGGFGTLDEACEFMTWNQLGIHEKKLAFLGPNGFFDDFEKFCHKLQDQKFTGTYDSFQPKFCHSIEEFFEWIH